MKIDAKMAILALGKVFSLCAAMLPLTAEATSYAPGDGFSYTAQEVRQWRQRAQKGPYRVAGDAQAYSPGDYTRISANANAFRANPAADRWNGGYQGSGCVPKGTSNEIMGYEPKPKGDKLRDAAFVFLLTQDRALGDLVVKELLGYVNHPLMDFSNRSRWCWGSGSVRDVNPGFFTAEWVTKMLYTYDYVRNLLSPASQEAIEQWLRNAAVYFQVVNDEPTDSLFKDRAQGILKDPVYWSATIAKSHHNGFDIPRLASHYNNRRASIARLIAQVGVLLGDEALKASARQFYIDWVKYAVFPDGMMTEYYRGDAGSPEKGYHYVVISNTLMLEIADIFARHGDRSLYDYETNLGIGATQGGRKDLHLVLTRIAKMVDGSTKRYFPGYGGQEAYLLNGIEPSGRTFVHDVWAASANIYFRDPYLRSVYLRQRPGTRPYPAAPANIGYSHPWSSTHATLPGLLFMHGQKENLAWPYSCAPLPNGTVTTEIAVKATGTVAREVTPLMRVYANGFLLGQVYVHVPAETYRFTVNLAPADIRQVTVQYVNDEVVDGADRNMQVDELKIGNGAPIVPSDLNSVFDRGALDGLDTVPGRRVLPWGGYLIVNQQAS